jgi:hydrogenase large subunit
MNGYWGNPAYKLPPEANLMAVAHYLEALDFQKEIVKVHTIFGGKNPHPNWLVGGVPCAINLEGTGAVGAINMERLNLVKSIIERCIEFVEQVYIPDLLAIAKFYKGWLYGGGLSSRRAVLRRHPGQGQRLLPATCCCRAARSSTASCQGARGRPQGPGADPGIRRPLLVQVPGRNQGPAPLRRRHRAELQARPEHQGQQDQDQGTSTKAASIRGSRRRAGAATPWKSAAVAHGHRLRAAQATRSSRSRSMVLKKLDVPVTALFSTLGRTAARGLECAVRRAQGAATSSTS